MSKGHFSPHWQGSVDWVPAWEPKGHWFNSQSGHVPGLLARPPVWGVWEATTHWCFSPSLFPPFPSLKINKYNIFEKRKKKPDILEHWEWRDDFSELKWSATASSFSVFDKRRDQSGEVPGKLFLTCCEASHYSSFSLSCFATFIFLMNVWSILNLGPLI